MQEKLGLEEALRRSSEDCSKQASPLPNPLAVPSPNLQPLPQHLWGIWGCPRLPFFPPPGSGVAASGPEVRAAVAEPAGDCEPDPAPDSGAAGAWGRVSSGWGSSRMRGKGCSPCCSPSSLPPQAELALAHKRLSHEVQRLSEENEGLRDTRPHLAPGDGHPELSSSQVPTAGQDMGGCPHLRNRRPWCAGVGFGAD